MNYTHLVFLFSYYCCIFFFFDCKFQQSQNGITEIIPQDKEAVETYDIFVKSTYGSHDKDPLGKASQLITATKTVFSPRPYIKEQFVRLPPALTKYKINDESVSYFKILGVPTIPSEYIKYKNALYEIHGYSFERMHDPKFSEIHHRSEAVLNYFNDKVDKANPNPENWKSGVINYY